MFRDLKQIRQLLDYVQLLILLITYSHKICPYAHKKYDEWHVALYLIHSRCSNNKVFILPQGKKDLIQYKNIPHNTAVQDQFEQLIFIINFQLAIIDSPPTRHPRPTPLEWPQSDSPHPFLAPLLTTTSLLFGL